MGESELSASESTFISYFWNSQQSATEGKTWFQPCHETHANKYSNPGELLRWRHFPP